MWIGIFLILLGALFLLDNLEILHGEVWSYAWPLALVLLGVSMIIGRLGNEGGRNKSKGADDDFIKHN